MDRNMPRVGIHARLVDRRLLREAVRREQLDGPVVRAENATLSLITWAPFSSTRPPRKSASAPLDLICCMSAS